MQARLAIVDVETTGSDPAADRVTEIAVLQAASEAEVADLLEARRPRFDYDHYRILSRHLGKRGVRVVPLAP